MPYKVIRTVVRPATSVQFYESAPRFIEKWKELLISDNVRFSDDGLTRTRESIWKTEDDYNKFIVDSETLLDIEKSISHNAKNGITGTIVFTAS